MEKINPKCVSTDESKWTDVSFICKLERSPLFQASAVERTDQEKEKPREKQNSRLKRTKLRLCRVGKDRKLKKNCAEFATVKFSQKELRYNRKTSLREARKLKRKSPRKQGVRYTILFLKAVFQLNRKE